MNRTDFLDTPRRIEKLAARNPDAALPLRALAEQVAKTDLSTLYDATVPMPDCTGLKYLDFAKHAVLNDEEARRLDLHRLKPRRILDLAAGSGSFCFVAKAYGHDCVALEYVHRTAEERGRPPIRTAPLFDFYGIPVSWQSIQPQQQIKQDMELSGRFDVITSYAIMFNVNRDKFWSAEDYLFLLRDLRDRFLNPGGVVALRFHGSLWGPRYSDRQPEREPYYHALGDLLQPYAIDPEPGSFVKLDLFRGELVPRAGLPQVTRVPGALAATTAH